MRWLVGCVCDEVAACLSVGAGRTRACSGRSLGARNTKPSSLSRSSSSSMMVAHYRCDALRSGIWSSSYVAWIARCLLALDTRSSVSCLPSPSRAHGRSHALTLFLVSHRVALRRHTLSFFLILSRVDGRMALAEQSSTGTRRRRENRSCEHFSREEVRQDFSALGTATVSLAHAEPSVGVIASKWLELVPSLHKNQQLGFPPVRPDRVGVDSVPSPSKSATTCQLTHLHSGTLIKHWPLPVICRSFGCIPPILPHPRHGADMRGLVIDAVAKAGASMH